MLQKLPDSTRIHVLAGTTTGPYETAPTLLSGQVAVSHPLEDVQEFGEVQVQACKETQLQPFTKVSELFCTCFVYLRKAGSGLRFTSCLAHHPRQRGGMNALTPCNGFALAFVFKNSKLRATCG